MLSKRDWRQYPEEKKELFLEKRKIKKERIAAGLDDEDEKKEKEAAAAAKKEKREKGKGKGDDKKKKGGRKGAKGPVSVSLEVTEDGVIVTLSVEEEAKEE